MKRNKFIILLAVVLILTFSTGRQVHAEKLLSKDKNACLGLNYHRIREDSWLDRILLIFSGSKELSLYSITDTTFEKQLKWLKAQDATFVTVDQLIQYKEKGKFPKRCVWINFDDMDDSIYLYAQPILKKYNIPATGFIITKQVGNKDFHNLPLMNKSQLQELQDSGLWTFGSHTHNLHTMEGDTSKVVLYPDQIIDDTKQSLDYLNKELGIQTNILAYPYGQISKEAQQAYKKTDIRYAFTLVEKSITKKSKDLAIPRILISNESFEKKVQTWKGFE